MNATRGGNGSTIPRATLRVDRLRDALTVAGLNGLGDEPWLAYLGTQRWFGAKGDAPTLARVIDVVSLPWDDNALGVAIIDVQTSSGIARYQLPLAVRQAPSRSLVPNSSLSSTASSAKAPSPSLSSTANSAKGSGSFDHRAVIAQVQAADGEAVLLDALHDPVFQRRLGEAFVATATFDSQAGGRWSIERASSTAFLLGPDAKIAVGSAEQSNSALIFGQLAFLKLFRKIETGVQPDVEMTRFLSVDAAFPRVPALFGTITYHDQGGGAVAGMMQEYLSGSRDAWAYILDSAKGGTATVAMHDIEQLGHITREMHDALAGEAAQRHKDFASVRAGAGDVERWAQRTKETIREATTLLDRQRVAGKLPAERAAEAEALVRRRDHYLTWIEEVADLIGDDGGAKIRIHGDYHLGQVLRTTSDSFVIIDFEGEPTRSLAQRREKTSALRDVAGMLRSLAYAAATLVRSGAGTTKRAAMSVAERELISGRWERDARVAFLRGYTGTMKDQRNLLPRDPKHFDALLSLFEAEKAFYELAYELNHRPGWEWIPMRGISRLLVK